MEARGVARVRNREYHVEGTVRGLASEGPRVERLFGEVQPAAVALGVGPEDLQGLSQFAEGTPYEHEYSPADEVYEHFLGQFGKVELPPGDLVGAVRAARERGLQPVAVDLPEKDYTDAFTREVTAFQLLRYQRLVQRLARKPPQADDAMGFHLAWDREVQRLKGFAALERLREETMAARLLEAPFPPGRVLVLVEGARVAGVLQALQGRKDVSVLS